MKENKKYLKWIIIILICAIVILAILLIKNKEINNETEKHNWIIKEEVVSKEDYYGRTIGMAVIPKWEEQTIAEQFYWLKYKEKDYYVKNTTISKEKIGNKIGEAILSGRDEYTQKTYTHNAIYYSVKQFQEECVIAIQYEGTNEYYIATNMYYEPKTLRNLIEDINLEETLSFGTIYYNYWDTSKALNEQYQQIEFQNIDKKIIWQKLFNDTTLENINENEINHQSIIMNISANISILGYNDIGIFLSEEGYLITNILETEKRFYIGKEKVQNFVNYIIENYDGYKKVYVDENGIPWTEHEEEAESGNDTIMVYDNTTNQTNNYTTNSSTQNFVESSKNTN